LSRTTRKWLDGYAKRFGLEKSEAVRILIEREKRVRWLEAAFNLPVTDLPIELLQSKGGLGRGGNKPLKGDDA
jgi:hypothetical protein